MVVILALVAMAVAPAAFLMSFVYVRDRHEREPLGLGVLLVLTLNWVISLRLIRSAQALSPFRAPALPAGIAPVLASAMYCITCGVAAGRPGRFCAACGTPWHGA